MSKLRVAAVTGANKGIGFAIVRQLALQYPKSALSNNDTTPLLIYLAARDPGRGEAALEKLQGDPPLVKAKALKSAGGLTDVKYHPLDIADDKSIQDFAAFLAKEHPDGIDIVINNASIAMDGFDNNVVKQTLGINYYGTLAATNAFLPVIRKGGRVVNITSTAGSLGKYAPKLADRFRNATSVDQVTTLMNEFTDAVKRGNEKHEGWPSAAYAVSKSGATAMTMIIGKEEAKSDRGVLVNACCPGWVKTDMTKGRGFKTPDQGAQTPVMLALHDIKGKHGLFWQNEAVIDY